MKITNLLLTVFAIFIANTIFTQTIHNVDLTPKITNDQILELGKSANQNSGKDVITLDFEGLGNTNDLARKFKLAGINYNTTNI
jgi:hypothetical protein